MANIPSFTYHRRGFSYLNAAQSRLPQLPQFHNDVHEAVLISAAAPVVLPKHYYPSNSLQVPSTSLQATQAKQSYKVYFLLLPA